VSAEQATALIVALTGLLGSIGLLMRQIGALRRDLNGRLEQLLETTSTAARKQGELAGRDFASRQPELVDVQRVDNP
jgi:hypothetical protein